MKTKFKIALFFLFGFTNLIFAQNFSVNATCDSTFSKYHSQKRQVKKAFKRIANSNYFSNHVRKVTRKSIKSKDYKRLESIASHLLHKEWCPEIERIARELIELDIPTLNSIILQEATTNFVKLNVASVSELCYLTCLLYTSPSPRDQRGSRMPSSA